MPRRSLVLVLGACAALLLGVARAAAPAAAGCDDLPPRPSGRVVLTVTGAIACANAPDGRAEFDRETLSGLGLSEVTTRTPWTDGEVTFEGVLARDLMAAVGARGSEVRAVALNDYEADIPLADFEAYPVLIAMRADGEPLRVRDKGPLWVIYPWSQHPELGDADTRAKSVWQLEVLDVR